MSNSELIEWLKKKAETVTMPGSRKMYQAAVKALEAQKYMVSRQAAIDGKICIRRSNGVEIYDDYVVPVEYLEQLPPAQPERIKGRWISADAIFGGEPFYCSKCGENTRDTVMGKPRWNFCPNCGAEMEVTT